MKKIVRILLTVIILLLVIFAAYSYVNDKSNNKREEEKLSQESARKESGKNLIINNLAKKYNALKDWDKNIDYTIQLQERVIGKPVLYYGYIEDVFLKDGKTFLKLSSLFSDISYMLELECDGQLTPEIRNSSIEESFGSYAVIARVDNISKASIKLTSIEDGDSSYVDWEFSDLFLGSGKCVDLVYLEE